MRKTKTTVAPKADPQNKELVEAIRALCQEKDLSEDMLFATVEDALKKAYAKNRAKGEAEPSANNISATIDRATGEIHVYTRRLIVEEVEKPADQISLEEARAIKDTYQMGDIVETDVTPRNCASLPRPLRASLCSACATQNAAECTKSTPTRKTKS